MVSRQTVCRCPKPAPRRAPLRSRRVGHRETLPNGYRWLDGDVGDYLMWGGRWYKDTGRGTFQIIQIMSQADAGWDPDDGKYLIVLSSVDINAAPADVRSAAIRDTDLHGDRPASDLELAAALDEYGYRDVIWNTFTDNAGEGLEKAARLR